MSIRRDGVHQPLWTLEDLQKVQALTGVAEVIEALGMHPRAYEASRHAMHRNAAQSMDQRLFEDIGVHIARADVREVRYKVVEVDEGRMQRKVQAQFRWDPSTLVVDLHGGFQDGAIVNVERYGQTLRFPVLLSDPLRLDTPPSPTELVPIEYIEYALDGWNPNTHHWVYRPLQPTDDTPSPI